MTVLVTAAELRTAFRPVAEAMLGADELVAARFWIAPIDDWNDERGDDALAEDSDALVWDICGETGCSSTLGLEIAGALPEVLDALANDLQDFIAESGFAWGALRPIPPIAP